MNNENLEKIKQLCDVEVPYNEVCSIHANALGEIQEAAERMAAEITQTKNVAHDFEIGFEDAQKEIARIKAELEKRPEVVRCGECKKKDLGFTCPLVCANAVIKAKTKVENFILFVDNDFCSAGQRRESEEGK
jgi:hypothetical protein